MSEHYDKKVLSIDFDYFQKVSIETMKLFTETFQKPKKCSL